MLRCAATSSEKKNPIARLLQPWRRVEGNVDYCTSLTVYTQSLKLFWQALCKDYGSMRWSRTWLRSREKGRRDELPRSEPWEKVQCPTHIPNGNQTASVRGADHQSRQSLLVTASSACWNSKRSLKVNSQSESREIFLCGNRGQRSAQRRSGLHCTHVLLLTFCIPWQLSF